MNKYIFHFIIFLFSFSLFAESDPIIVRLATESQLMPLYLGKISDEGSGLDAHYVNQLEGILRFDLNYNGMTKVLDAQSSLDSLCANNTFAEPKCLTVWRGKNIYFVVVATIKEKVLSAQMLLVNNQTAKSVANIPLTGSISEDRREIHKLSNAIYKALFDAEGIATTRILYTVKNGNLSEVWEADYDGANARQITHENALCVHPIYMPPKAGFSSGSFFFVSYKSGQPKIFLASLKEGKPRRLTLLKGNQLMPAISRQRDKVAFISDVAGNPDLFLQDFQPEKGAIGKPRQIFASPRSTQGCPTFNPDGSRLAFVSNKDGVPRIYVMEVPSIEVTNIKDIRATLVTKRNVECTAPSWSPDGTKLAYSSMTNGTRQIWIYDFDAKMDTQLTQGVGHKENPVWAPNSTHLIFNSSGRGTSELYLINLNQAEAVKITQGKGDKRFPSWTW